MPRAAKISGTYMEDRDMSCGSDCEEEEEDDDELLVTQHTHLLDDECQYDSDNSHGRGTPSAACKDDVQGIQRESSLLLCGGAGSDGNVAASSIKENGSSSSGFVPLQRNNTNSRSPAVSARAVAAYNMPPSSSTPVNSHFDAVLECLDLLRTMERDESVQKQDVIDSLSSMLNNMLKTIMMHSFATSMSVSGWRVE